MIDITARRRAPRALRTRDDLCGPVAAWQALRFFGRRAQTKRLLELTGWQPGVGAHAIGIAVALATYGLCIEFQSDTDHRRQPAEVSLYAQARALGIHFAKPMAINQLLKELHTARLPLLFFEHGSVDFGHFEVLRGVERGHVVLGAEGLWLRPSILEKRRRARAILRQTIIVSDAV